LAQNAAGTNDSTSAVSDLFSRFAVAAAFSAAAADASASDASAYIQRVDRKRQMLLPQTSTTSYMQLKAVRKATHAKNGARHCYNHARNLAAATVVTSMHTTL